ncbi:MAG: ABC transporter permease [Parasporobacterium sp.]|nr:ABC transporter permease [Parasporobacterium sp.]
MTATKNSVFSRKNIQTFLPVIGLVIVIVLFAFTTGGKLFSAYNLSSIIAQSVCLTIVSTGAVFTYALGSLDLSIGPTMGLCALIAALITNNNGSILLAFLAALGITISFSFINSVVSYALHLDRILTTLFLSFTAGGLQLMISSSVGGTIYAMADWSLFKSTSFQFIVMAVVVLLGIFLFNFTTIGKYGRAMGSNRVCAGQSGINIIKYQIIIYIILAICTAIGSLFLVSRAGSISWSTGSGFHMDVMIALILGGMPMRGGVNSRIISAPIGSFTYTILSNGLTLSGVNMSIVGMCKALVFIVVIILTCRNKGRVIPR